MAMLKLINPATGKHEAALPIDGVPGLRAKVGAARSAQRDWAGTSLRDRLAVIVRFRRLLEVRRDELATLLTRDMGKPITQSRNELTGLLGRLDFFLAETPRVLRPKTVSKDTDAGLTERITQEPLGVIVNISAWNYPYFVGSNVFIPALLTGNAVLYKPSELVARTGLAISGLLHESGVPQDVFAPIIGGAETGAALLRQPIDGVFFTGSHATGRRIARAVSGRLVKVQLELGGKDPVYVCDDVDIAAAAASVADGAFYNTGQSCCSVERVYVHRSIASRFVEAFVETVAGLKIGDPMDESTYIGPLARRAQLAVLESQVANAKAKGGVVLLGGRPCRGRGNYFEPTVVTNVNHRMTLMRDETFGPVVGVMTVDDDAQAVALMNDTPYGLTAGVYTKDRRRAEQILLAINSGSVYWNCCDRVSPRLPWSGRGHSGLGLTLSSEGIRTFTQPKAWHLRREP